MKRQLEIATEVPPELDSQEGAESPPELLNANDAALQAPIRGDVSIPEWHGVGAQAESLPKLRVLWAKRQLMLYCGLTGCCVAILVALVIPKEYVSAAKLMPPEAQFANKLANCFGGNEAR